MKGWFFAVLILAFAVYTLITFFTGWNTNYGVWGILVTMGSEVAYDKWLEKRNANKA